MYKVDCGHSGGEGLVKLGLLVRTKLFSTNENLLGRESRERGGGKGLVVDGEYGGVPWGWETMFAQDRASQGNKSVQYAQDRKGKRSSTIF